MKKFFSITVLALILVLSMAMAVACDPIKDNPPENYDYKITVLDVDGKPCVDALIQVCTTGEVPICFNELLTVDNNGICYIDAGNPDSPVEVPSTLTEVEIHVRGLKNYYTHDTCIVKKGEAAVIKMKESFPENEGTGVGEFDGEVLKTEGYDPYKMIYEPNIANPQCTVTGYKVPVNENNKTMYIELETDPDESYSIKVVGAKGTITILEKNENGIVKTNKTATGEDPTIVFSVEDDEEDYVTTYFEIAFDASAVGKDVIIELNYAE